MLRLAIVASHPIQYQAPLFRKLASLVELEVFYVFSARPEDQALAGFGTAFEWDIDLLSGYTSRFLKNVSNNPAISFSGCDTPEVGAILRSGRFDAVLVLGWYLKAFVQAAFACRVAGIPVMVRGDSHLLEPRSVIKKATKMIILPPALRSFDAALYVGERSRAFYLRYGYPQSRLFFSPHCVDETQFEEAAVSLARLRLRNELGIAADSRVALFVGKLVPRKRVSDLLRAAAMLRERGSPLHVVIAGSGPEEGELRALAVTLQVDARFSGFQNQSAIPAFYAASDVLVLPSDNESWGLVANEALASRRPLVLSDMVGCAPDLAGDARAGRVFKTGDIAALASALQQVLQAPPSREALADRARRYSTAAAAEGIIAAADFAAGVRTALR